ncbi:MAG: terminase small subunit [Gammaproteobacteria bacterium]|nr:terminase small subunit [Gammaproteobacteria bacterium]MCP5458086.1 terminase small subunit [Gammaproteobacteria bacterium]
MSKYYFDILQLAEIFNVRRHTIVGWVNRGCPVIHKSDRVKRQDWQFDLAEVVRWHEEQSKQQMLQHEPVSSLVGAEDEQTRIEKAQRRKAVAEAEIAELQLAKTRGDLIEKRKVKEILASIAQRDLMSWHRWGYYVAKILASELDVDEERTHGIIEMHLRQQLRELSQPGLEF